MNELTVLNNFRKEFFWLNSLFVYLLMRLAALEFVFYKIPEPSWFPYATELVAVCTPLAYGYITSWIFYYLVVYRKEFKQKSVYF
jgi:hypothetical protein